MKVLEHIPLSNHPYEVSRRFHNHVEPVPGYMIKTLGVDHDEKKPAPRRKIIESKRTQQRIKASVLFHMLRKRKPSKKKRRRKSLQETVE
ncbi:MAG TPA: hypothetical protein VNY73_06190 [Bacteroidia bacterium]|nr:hypothetical protein [Bacteroidia bacterium]